MLFNYFFTNAMPHCMPFTFFMSDVTVEMVVLVELLPSVFKIKICLFELFYILKDYVVVKK